MNNYVKQYIEAQLASVPRYTFKCWSVFNNQYRSRISIPIIVKAPTLELAKAQAKLTYMQEYPNYADSILNSKILAEKI